MSTTRCHDMTHGHLTRDAADACSGVRLDLGEFATDPRVLKVEDAESVTVFTAGGHARPQGSRWVAQFDDADLGVLLPTLDEALRYLLGKPQPAKENAR